MFVGRSGQERKNCSVCVARKIQSNARRADPEYKKKMEERREEIARIKSETERRKAERKAEAARKKALLSTGEYFKCTVCDKVLHRSDFDTWNGKRRQACHVCLEKSRNRVPSFKPKPTYTKDGHKIRLMPDKECNYPTANGATVFLVNGMGEKPRTAPVYGGLFQAVLNKSPERTHDEE